MPVADCCVIEVPEYRDARGALVAFEPPTVPFTPVRTFVIHDVPVGAVRGSHAHKECHELLVAFGGTVTVAVSDPHATRQIVLDHPTRALHLAPLTWLDIVAMSPGAICMVLCSHRFDEADYMRDRAAFDALLGAEA